MKNYLFLLLLVLVGCNSNCNKKAAVPETVSYWHYTDYGKDSVAGISLYKAKDSFFLNRENKPLIIALIDSDVDIHHEDLKNNIWVNKDEILANGKDDDANGYVDDIYGWNFLGNSEGNSQKFANNSSVRYLNHHQNRYKELVAKSDTLDPLNKNFLLEYQRAFAAKYTEEQQLIEYEEYVDWYETSKPSSDSLLETYGIQKPYNPLVLDSLFNFVYVEGKDESRGRLIYFALDDVKNNRNEAYKESLRFVDLNRNYALNEAFNERSTIGDDPNNMTEKNYGNGIVDGNLDQKSHGTEMAGAIAAESGNGLGGFGVLNNAEIMFLPIFPETGTEHEKDLANAIRYAVENGAKVINYSSTVNFMAYPKVVYDAIKYAEEKDVLFIAAAGNEGLDLDKNMTHPRNNFMDYSLSNFIMVGVSDSLIGPNIKPVWGNHGKNTVDLFAPGVDFYTSLPNNKYHKNSGSSISTALVTGVSALIRSKYENLTASQVKQCIVATVNNYDGEVYMDEEKTKSIPFDQLSRSGGVLNAFNALKMASEIDE